MANDFDDTRRRPARFAASRIDLVGDPVYTAFVQREAHHDKRVMLILNGLRFLLTPQQADVLAQLISEPERRKGE